MATKALQRALAVHQPFAELIVSGEKVKEFRSRRTHLRERVYVYACAKLDSEDINWCNENYPDLDIQSLPRGVLVGTVEIVGCERDGDRGYAWQLGEEEKFAKPMTAKRSHVERYFALVLKIFWK